MPQTSFETKIPANIAYLQAKIEGYKRRCKKGGAAKDWERCTYHLTKIKECQKDIHSLQTWPKQKPLPTTVSEPEARLDELMTARDQLFEALPVGRISAADLLNTVKQVIHGFDVRITELDQLKEVKDRPND